MGAPKCYVCADGTNVIRVWYDLQDPGIQGQFVGVLVALESISPARWPEDLFKPLGKRTGSNCDGLAELILVVDRRHLRIVGYQGPREGDFTMLYAFDKNEDASYEVPCEEAQRRKAEVERDWTRSREHEFP